MLPPPAGVTLNQTAVSPAQVANNLTGSVDLAGSNVAGFRPVTDATSGVATSTDINATNPMFSDFSGRTVNAQTSSGSFLDDPIQGLKDLYGNYLSPSRPGVGPRMQEY